MRRNPFLPYDVKMVKWREAVNQPGVIFIGVSPGRADPARPAHFKNL